MLALFALTMAGVDRLAVLSGLLFIGYGFLGLVIPTSSVLALEEHGTIAGTASALMGTLQFMTGAIVDRHRQRLRRRHARCRWSPASPPAPP